MDIKFRSFAMLAIFGIAACTVGPNFKPPAADVPASFVTPQAANPIRVDSVTVDSDPDPAWWREFNDPVLNSVEDRAQQGNLDLRTGLLRIVQARLQVQLARAQGLPTLNASASYKREQLGAKGILESQGGAQSGALGGSVDPALISELTKDVNLYQVGFDASWELDLFGKVRRTVEQAKAQADEQVESHNDMLVSLQAEVATNYFQLRAAQLQTGITTELIDNAREILALNQDRQQHGLQGEADVETARAQVTSLEAQLPQYAQQAAIARHALAVLTGQVPAALDQELTMASALPAMPPRVPVGLPAALARRRPDIRQAEAALHAATAEIGVSVAALYPDISLSGMFGLRNTSTDHLFDWASKFYSIGPSISLPIFKGGALVTNVKIARADAAAATLQYRKTVLTALQEVEDGLVGLDADQQRMTAMQATVTANQHALDINTQSYKFGMTNYINVLTSQVQRDQTRLQLAQVTATQMTDLVKLYKALAGGWQAPQSTPVAASGE